MTRMTRRSRSIQLPAVYPVGSLESRAAARAVLLARDLENREKRAAQLQNAHPLVKVVIQEIDDPRRQALLRLVQAMVDRAALFHLKLPTPETIRRICRQRD